MTGTPGATAPKPILILTLLYLCLLPAGATVALVMLGNTAPVPLWLAAILAPWSAFMTCILIARFARVHPRPIVAIALLLDGPLFGAASMAMGGGFDPWRMLLNDALIDGLALTIATGISAEREYGTRWRDRLAVLAIWGSIPLFPLYLCWPILRDAFVQAPLETGMVAAGVVYSCIGYLRTFKTAGLDGAVTSQREAMAFAPGFAGMMLWLVAIGARKSLPGWFG